jgi:hypothetical protein
MAVSIKHDESGDHKEDVHAGGPDQRQVTAKDPRPLCVCRRDYGSRVMEDHHRGGNTAEDLYRRQFSRFALVWPRLILHAGGNVRSRPGI